jgi:hypothetical protein
LCGASQLLSCGVQSSGLALVLGWPLVFVYFESRTAVSANFVPPAQQAGVPCSPAILAVSSPSQESEPASVCKIDHLHPYTFLAAPARPHSTRFTVHSLRSGRHTNYSSIRAQHDVTVDSTIYPLITASPRPPHGHLVHAVHLLCLSNRTHHRN